MNHHNSDVIEPLQAVKTSIAASFHSTPVLCLSNCSKIKTMIDRYIDTPDKTFFPSQVSTQKLLQLPVISSPFRSTGYFLLSYVPNRTPHQKRTKKKNALKQAMLLIVHSQSIDFKQPKSQLVKHPATQILGNALALQGQPSIPAGFAIQPLELAITSRRLDLSRSALQPR